MNHFSSNLLSTPFVGNYVRNNPFLASQQQEQQGKNGKREWDAYQSNYKPSPITEFFIAYKDLYRVGHNKA
jgi:hypothetical protein